MIMKSKYAAYSTWNSVLGIIHNYKYIKISEFFLNIVLKHWLKNSYLIDSLNVHKLFYPITEQYFQLIFH